MTEPTVRSFLASLAANVLEIVRYNKLPAGLSIAALVITSMAVFRSQYDERDRYRQTILPDLQQAEARFFGSLEDAENAINETWRLHYFLIAHNRARDVLTLAKSRWPRTEAGIRAHNELVRYYELVTEQLAIIRTEMSINEELDYLDEWHRQDSDLGRVRQGWVRWTMLPATPSVLLTQ